MIRAELVDSRRLKNALTKIALVAAILAIFAVSALLVGGREALPILVAAMIVSVVLLPRVTPRMVMRLHGARRMTPGRAAVFRADLAMIARRADLAADPDIYWLPSAAPAAFATGDRDDAAIAISEANLRLLTRRELVAVLAHEVAHIANGDGRLNLAIDVIRQTTSMIALFGIAMLFGLIVEIPGVEIPFWLPVALILGPAAGFLLQRALMRTCEFAADSTAVDLTGDPEGLAAALHKIESVSRRQWARFIGLGNAEEIPSFLRTHPDSDERIRRLLTRRKTGDFSWSDQSRTTFRSAGPIRTIKWR